MIPAAATVPLLTTAPAHAQGLRIGSVVAHNDVEISIEVGPFGVQALACPTQCSLKAELRTCARHDAKFDHFVNLVAT